MERTFGHFVCETSSTTGLGPIMLAGVKADGFFSFRQQYPTSPNTVTEYTVVNRQNTKAEHHRGATFTHGEPDQLTRSVWKSTSNDAPIYWTIDDLPLTVYVPASADALELAITGNAGAARHALLREAAVWPDTTNGWSGRVPFSLNPLGTEREVGAWDGASGIYVPSPRRPYTAVGAANKTLGANDIAGCFTFDNSAASRSALLPSGASVGIGYTVRVEGESDSFPLVLVPDGTDAIDYGAGGSSLNLPGQQLVDVTWTGAKWRTNLPPVPRFTKAVTFTGVSSVSFVNFPSNVNFARLRFYYHASNNGATTSLRTAGADGVFGTGASDYSFQQVRGDGSTASASSTTASANTFGNLSNTANSQIWGTIEFYGIGDPATYTRWIGKLGFLNSTPVSVTAINAATRAEVAIITGVQILIGAGTMDDGRALLELF